MPIPGAKKDDNCTQATWTETGRRVKKSQGSRVTVARNKGSTFWRLNLDGYSYIFILQMGSFCPQWCYHHAQGLQIQSWPEFQSQPQTRERLL